MQGRAVFFAECTRVYELLGVQLDDEMLFDREFNVLSCRGCDDLADQVVRVKLEPLGNDDAGIGFDVLAETLDLAAGFY